MRESLIRNLTSVHRQTLQRLRPGQQRGNAPQRLIIEIAVMKTDIKHRPAWLAGSPLATLFRCSSGRRPAALADDPLPGQIPPGRQTTGPLRLSRFAWQFPHLDQLRRNLKTRPTGRTSMTCEEQPSLLTGNCLCELSKNETRAPAPGQQKTGS